MSYGLDVIILPDIPCLQGVSISRYMLTPRRHGISGILISTNQDPQSSRHLMTPFGKDETSHASPVGTILPFTLHVTGLIPHGHTHTLLGYEPFLLLLLLSLRFRELTFSHCG